MYTRGCVAEGAGFLDLFPWSPTGVFFLNKGLDLTKVGKCQFKNSYTEAELLQIQSGIEKFAAHRPFETDALEELQTMFERIRDIELPENEATFHWTIDHHGRLEYEPGYVDKDAPPIDRQLDESTSSEGDTRSPANKQYDIMRRPNYTMPRNHEPSSDIDPEDERHHVVGRRRRNIGRCNINVQQQGIRPGTYLLCWMEGQKDTDPVERDKREFIVAQVLSVFKFKPGFNEVPDEFKDEAERGDKKFCLVQLLQPVSGKQRKDRNGQVIQPRKKQFGEQVFRLSVYLDTKEPEIRVMSISNIVVFFDSLTRTGSIPAKALKRWT